MPADFYHGRSTPDFNTIGNGFAFQWRPMGAGGSTPHTIANTEAQDVFVVPQGGIIITELARGMDSPPSNAGKRFNMGVYDVSSTGGSIVGATLIGETTIQARTDNAGYVWHSAEGLNIPVAAGKTIVMAVTPTISDAYLASVGQTIVPAEVWHTAAGETSTYFSDGTPETALPATFPGAPIGPGRVIPMRFGYSLANSSATLHSINGNGTLPVDVAQIGVANNSISTSGMGALTSLTIGGKAMTSLNAPAGDGSFAFPALVDEQTTSRVGTVQAVVADASGTANKSVTVLPPVGHGAVTLAGSLNTTQNGVLFNKVPAAAVGNQVIFPLSMTVDAQGNIDTDLEGVATLWLLDNAAPPVAKSYTITLGASLDSTPNAINFSNIATSAGTVVTSSPANGVQVTGITVPLTLEVVGGESMVADDGQPLGVSNSQPKTINPNGRFRLRGTAGAQPGDVTNVAWALRYQGNTVASGTWVITVLGGTAPNAFTLTNVTNAVAGQYVSLGSFTVNSSNSTTDHAIAPGAGVQWRLKTDANAAYGSMQTGAGTARSGNVIEVFGLASSTAGALVTRSFDVGGTVGTATITTAAAVGPGPDTTPNAFTMTAVTNAAANTSVSMGVYTVSGADAGIDLPVTVGASVQYRARANSGAAWGGLLTSGNVQNGWQVEVFGVSSPTAGGQVTRSITVGGITSSTTITTAASQNPGPAPSYGDIVDVGGDNVIPRGEPVLVNAPNIAKSRIVQVVVRHSSGREYAVPFTGWPFISVPDYVPPGQYDLVVKQAG